jgi:hypothetical protein
MNSTEMNWVAGIFLKLLTQLQDVVVHGASRGVMLISPNFIKQFLPGDYLLGILHHKFHNLEFLRSERHWLPRASQLHLRETDGNIAKAERVTIRRPRRAAKGGTNTRQQFSRAKWLGYVVIRAQFEQQNFVSYFRGSAQNDDRNMGRRLLDLPANVASCESRKAKIEENDSGLRGLKGFEAGTSIGRRIYIKAFRLEEPSQRTANFRVVLYNEDSFHKTPVCNPSQARKHAMRSSQCSVAACSQRCPHFAR